MKTSRFLPAFLVIMLILSTFIVCIKKNNAVVTDEAADIFGSWAYAHDKETAVAVFNKDGTARYESMDFTYEYDSEFIKLKNTEGETIQLRYTLDKDGMYLYSNNVYTYNSEGEPEGLVGEWLCPEKNWSYNFTEKGTFLEDGYFPGYYTVDDKSSTFKLVYNDDFADTVCYFRLEKDKLYIEYPWHMVKMNVR